MLQDLYKALNLEPDASIQEIKKAYRLLAKEYHPDKNSNGAEKFKEISHAYSILVDPEKKNEYIMKCQQQQEEEEQEEEYRYYDYSSPFDFFNTSYYEARQKSTREDFSIRVSHNVTLEEIYNGFQTKVRYKEPTLCPDCQNDPRHPNLRKHQKCNNCDGRGTQFRTVNRKMTTIKCVFCRGKGTKTDYARCDKCQNKAYSDRKVSFLLPRGVHDGHSIQLKNRGCLMPDGKTKGPLNIRILQKPHDIFTRNGDNLFITVTISLKEAIMGFKQKALCIHLDGRTIIATQPIGSVIKPNSKRVIKGEGMPIYNSNTDAFGDLFVTFKVEFPDKIQVPETREAKIAIEELFETDQQRDAKKNAIVIDDDDDDNDDGEVEKQNIDKTKTESKEHKILEVISDTEEASETEEIHEDISSDEEMGDSFGFSGLFNVFF